MKPEGVGWLLSTFFISIGRLLQNPNLLSSKSLLPVFSFNLLRARWYSFVLVPTPSSLVTVLPKCYFPLLHLQESLHSSSTCSSSLSKSRTPDVVTHVHLPCPRNPCSSPLQLLQGEFLFLARQWPAGQLRQMSCAMALTLLYSSWKYLAWHTAV